MKGTRNDRNDGLTRPTRSKEPCATECRFKRQQRDTHNEPVGVPSLSESVAICLIAARQCDSEGIGFKNMKRESTLTGGPLQSSG